jgi:hypothetical protein
MKSHLFPVVRNIPRRIALAVVVAAVGLAALLSGAPTARAQLMPPPFSTSTAVASGGTIAFAVTTAGVQISSNTGLGTCTTTTALPAANVTYTCPAGLFMGANVQQTFTVPSGPIAETVTYNANGPVSVPAATTAGPTACTPAASPYTCTVTLGAPTASGGVLSLVVSPAGGESLVITGGPAVTCAQSPLSFSSVPTTSPITVTYTCGASQTIAAGPISLVVSTSPATPAPSIAANINANGPITVPAPSAPQAVNVPGPSAATPVISSIDPSSGPPGTQVTLNGSNLTGVTAVNFGTTSANIAGCNAGGTSCGVYAPLLPNGTTANVTVVTGGGTSNAISFAYNSGGPGPIIGPGGGFGFGPPPPPSGLIGANTIPLPAGWNLLGGGSGTTITGTPGPLFTYQGGGYQTINAGTGLEPGLGYWAYLATGGSMTIPIVSLQPQSVPLPAGQWTMIGNPTSSPVQVFGGDVVYTYSPVSNYQISNTLQPGQGAWVFSFNGGTLTMTVI